MNPVKIRLGGVPEHFNVPIHLAIKEKAFLSRNVDVQWTDFHGGTGEMTAALRNNDIDACILLTEGIIKDIIQGNPSKIISIYVKTPLTWGIHTGINNKLAHHTDIYDKRYAISRKGSGSQLMAIVDASAHHREIKEEQYRIIKNLDGAVNSLSNLDSDVFYWEKFMTKPYVDRGILRRVGEFQSPWPCFVIAARDDILEKHPEAIIRMLRTIHDICDNFMYNDNAIDIIREYHDIPEEDLLQWFHSTEWAIHGWVSDKMLKSVVFNLRNAGIIEKGTKIPELVWKR